MLKIMAQHSIIKGLYQRFIARKRYHAEARRRLKKALVIEGAAIKLLLRCKGLNGKMRNKVRFAFSLLA